MMELESMSPGGLEYKLRENKRVALLELRLEYRGRHIPITTTDLQILSELERERAYEELIRSGPPYRSGNLEKLNRKYSGLRGRELAEPELIPPELIEKDPQGENQHIYRLSAIALEGRYVAVVRDERVNS